MNNLRAFSRVALGMAILFFSLSGCSTHVENDPPSAEQSTSAKVQAAFDKIEIGSSRASVEELLGKPFSEEKSVEGTTAIYMPGMGEMMAKMQGQMQAQSGIGIGSGIANTAIGALGMTGPAGAVAAGVGGQLLGLGQSLAASAAMPPVTDPGDMQILTVTYRDSKVVAVQRMNPGQMAEPGE